MSSIREQALEIYKKHIALASTDGKLFRKTVLDEYMATFGCSVASAATHYNNSKKVAPVEGLGRLTANRSAKKQNLGKNDEVLQDDNDCFSVLELIPNENGFKVGRCQSFLAQGDASETFDIKHVTWPKVGWVLIRGLGPISGELYRLSEGEKEIKRHLAA